METTAGNSKHGKQQRRGLSISWKLIIAVTICIVAAMAIFVWVIYNQISRMMIQQSEEILTATTDSVVGEAHAWVSRTLATLEMERDTIEYERMSAPQIRAYVQHTAGTNDAYPAGLYVAYPDGNLIHASFIPGPDFDATSKSWYKNGIRSDDFILGDVYFDDDSKTYVVGASGALKNTSGETIGVAAADVYLGAISEIVSDVELLGNGGVSLVDTRDDIIIGDQNPDYVGINLADADSELFQRTADMLQRHQSGLATVGDTYLSIAYIPDSDWAAVAYVPASEVTGGSKQIAIQMIWMAALVVFALVILVNIMVRRIIGRPVREMSKVATSIAEGHLDQEIKYRSTDELGVLANDFNEVTVRLRDYVDYINEISDALQQIGDGDLRVDLKHKYEGEFAKIKNSLEHITERLTGTMGHIQNASRDVAAGATQVSSEATSLSQGSTRQEQELRGIAEHIASLSENVNNIALGAEQASNISTKVHDDLLVSEDKMRNMTNVIEGISAKSAQIHQIVKTIEDIAFQTNILALNAAVEAARAGNTGKGFAVVADEVRNLAAKSSEAAQQTTLLLGQTVDSMSDSVKAAEDTASSIESAVRQSEEMSQLITRIADYTRTQASDTQEISHGISEITNLGQRNVAVSESSAAASEQLAGQAELLKDMASRFKLRGE